MTESNEDAIANIKLLNCNKYCIGYGADGNARCRADICAFGLAISALEKQIPKKPVQGQCGILCPSCQRKEYIMRRDALDVHCGFCGQAIDWSTYD